MDLLDKLRVIEKRRATFAAGQSVPGQTVIDRVLSPGEVIVGGRPTLMFGSNNYLGLTLHPQVTEAARRAVLEYGTGTTGSRTANGTLAIHEDLERELADWFGKRQAIIFSTGYQANLVADWRPVRRRRRRSCSTATATPASTTRRGRRRRR